MVRASFEQKPYRRVMMEVWGADVEPSPVDDPEHPGSLGSRHQRRRARRGGPRRFALLAGVGAQPRAAAPDGDRARGQGAAGRWRARSGPTSSSGRAVAGRTWAASPCPSSPTRGVDLLAVEPSSCPTLTEGRFEYDFGDTAGMTPLLAMYTLGHDFVPPSIHAGGLRYHGDAPIICNLVKNGRMRAVAYPQGKVFDAAVQFARTEGTIPAPETAHAIRAVIDEALAAQGAGRRRRSSSSLLRARSARPRRLRRLPPRPPGRRTPVLVASRPAVNGGPDRSPLPSSATGTRPSSRREGGSSKRDQFCGG